MPKTMCAFYQEKIDNMTIKAMNAPVSERPAIIKAREVLQKQLDKMTIKQCETLVKGE